MKTEEKNGAAVATAEPEKVETFPTGNGKVVEGSVKTTEESALELAHSELLATARICSKFKGRMTKLNALSMGESAMEALAQYYVAHQAFEKSVG